MLLGLANATNFPSGSAGELALISFAGFFFLIIGITMWNEPPEMRGDLVKEMRLIAGEPVPDPNDPRFKKWNVRSRFPNATGG
jgi:hypothetical protein